MEKDAGKANESGLYRGGPNFHPVFGSYFEKAQFPQDMDSLERIAEEHKAGSDIMERLEKMPRRTYNSMEEFRKVFIEGIDNYGAVREPDAAVTAWTPPPTSD
jgi:hypothetical protein